MCRKLIYLVALLGIVSVASGQMVTPIDDFESYWGTPAMTPPWSDAGPAPSTASMELLISGAPYGSQAGQMDWTVPGGWANPDDPTNYEGYDHAQANVAFDPYDFRYESELRMTINPESAAVMQYLIEYNSEGMYAQTWIPGSGNYGVQYWLNPALCPGVIVPPYEPFPDWGGQYAADWQDLKEIPAGVWTDIAITANMVVPWSDITTLAAYDALDGFAVSAWPIMTPDTSGASGPPKMDGTVEVWPPGEESGNIGVDEIYFFIIPEPTTIALLALGGLALRRTKKQ